MEQPKPNLTDITRKCYVCGEIKLITEFKKNPKQPLGYGYICFNCNRKRLAGKINGQRKEYQKAYHLEHADKINAAQREKYRTNPQYKEQLKNQKKHRRYHICPYKRAYNHSRYNNKYRNTPREFTLTLEYMLNLAKQQKHRCALTGTPFNTTKTGEKQHDTLLPSIDRINSDIGYIPGNVQWTTIWANRAKRDTPQKRFIEMCQNVTQNNPITP